MTTKPEKTFDKCYNNKKNSVHNSLTSKKKKKKGDEVAGSVWEDNLAHFKGNVYSQEKYPAAKSNIV